MVAPITAYAALPTLQEYAEGVAHKYKLNADTFKAVINCESRWDPNAIGDNGQSFGVAQFFHPERDWGFTRVQALNPYFAIEQMALAWNKGEAPKWSCYNLVIHSTP